MARKAGRGDARRSRREQAVALPEGTPSAADLVERVALQRDVAGRVLSLEEPYRETLLLRFVEGRPPREIARRMNVPVNTVRTRVERGLERIRGQLDRSHGDRTAWCVALVPLAESGRGAVHGSLLTLVGGWIMTWPLRLLFTAAAALCAWLFVGPLLDGPPDPGSASSTVAMGPVAPDLEEEEEEGVDAVREAVTAEPALEPPQPEDLGSSPEPETLTVRGRVVDPDGRGIPRMGLAVRPIEGGAPIVPPVQTDDGGRFVLDLPAEWRDDIEFHLERAGWATIGMATAETSPGEDERIIIVHPVRSVEGVVRDPGGQPIAEARVSDSASLFACPNLPWELRGIHTYSRPSVFTDANGRFVLPQGAVGFHAEITAAHPSHHQASQDPTAGPTREVEIVLHPRGDDVKVLSGLVVLEEGRPASGATVYFGQHSTKSDDGGRFSLNVRYHDRRHGLVAYKRGLQPGSRPGFGEEYHASPGDRSDLLLQLGGPVLSVTGRVVDGQGRPLPGHHVRHAGPFTLLGISGWTAQSKLTGGRVSMTDDEGRFRIDGLSQGSLRLSVSDPQSNMFFLSEPVVAGAEDVELRIPPSLCFDEYRGRVVDRLGRPVPDAEVMVIYYTIKEPGGPSSYGGGRSVTTDHDGGFVLTRVPRRDVYLSVAGRGLEERQHAVEDLGGPFGVTLTAVRTHRFRVVAEDRSIDRFSVLDDDGSAVRVYIRHGSGIRGAVDVRREGDRFPVCQVTDEEARELAFFRGGEEVWRQPLETRRGELTEISPGG